MANFLNANTKEYKTSQDTNEYLDENGDVYSPWIKNPDLTAVKGWLPKYWIVDYESEVISLMTKEEREALDAAEAALPSSRFKIYDYMTGDFNHFEKPWHIDYTIQPSKRFYDYPIIDEHGALDSLIWYADYDPATKTYSNPIVKETHTYIRNPFPSPAMRTIDIQWYYDDGVLADSEEMTKKRVKLYDSKSSKKALIKERENVIANLEYTVLGLIYQTEAPKGKTFAQCLALGYEFIQLQEHSIQSASFMSSGSDELRQHVMNDPNGVHAVKYPWMFNEIDPEYGVTIKDVMVQVLTDARYF